MDGSVCHVIGHYPPAFLPVHYEVQREILNEEDAVVTQSATKQSVEHRVASPISNRTTSIRLTTCPEFQRLTSERSLVNLSFLSSTERHPV